MHNNQRASLYSDKSTVFRQYLNFHSDFTMKWAVWSWVLSKAFRISYLKVEVHFGYNVFTDFKPATKFIYKCENITNKGNLGLASINVKICKIT